MGKQSTRKNKTIYQICREEAGLTRSEACDKMEAVSDSRLEKFEYELQDPARADLALACVKTEDGKKYLGRTCLTLKMAYHNARLLAKIHSSWLCP